MILLWQVISQLSQLELYVPDHSQSRLPVSSDCWSKPLFIAVSISETAISNLRPSLDLTAHVVEPY